MDSETIIFALVFTGASMLAIGATLGVIAGIRREIRKAREVRDWEAFHGYDLHEPASRDRVVRIRKGTLPDAIGADYN